MKKSRLLGVGCALALTLWASPSFAASGEYVTVDALVVRPMCIMATAVGSVVFCVALPFAAISKSVKPTAHALVVAPAKAAFSRPMGDFESLENLTDED